MQKSIFFYLLLRFIPFFFVSPTPQHVPLVYFVIPNFCININSVDTKCDIQINNHTERFSIFFLFSLSYYGNENDKKTREEEIYKNLQNPNQSLSGSKPRASQLLYLNRYSFNLR